jgi:flagellar hook assembly protein FlgD
VRARGSAYAAIALVPALVLSSSCGREDRQTPKKLRAEIEALERERDTLRGKMNELVVRDPRLKGLPETPIKVGVPTTLARDLIQRVVAGFVDQVTLELKNLKVKKSGTVKKVVTIGQYDLNVTINRVIGKLKTGKPEVTFGGNKVAISLPVTVASGTGNATIRFKWDGKNVAGATCGDLEVTQDVSGSVRPDSYPVAGALVLTATAKDILAQPHFPVIKVNLKVQPSKESWAAVQKLLDDKEGLCGYVVEKVNVLGIVQNLIDKGFNVRLPTEKIKAMAVPVGIEPEMEVRGQPVALAIELGELAITEQMIWLGARVSVKVGEEAPPS